MPSGPSARAAIVVAVVAGSLAIVGCGVASSNVTGDKPGDGKQIFADAGCGGCHTLAAAGSDGTSGPNLDDLAPTAAAVSAQVKSGGGGMPAFAGKLTAKQIAAVAAFVSAPAYENAPRNAS